MKRNFLYISVSFLLLAAFSCSNDFLNDNIEQEDILSGDSEIVISPSWDVDDYQFTCPNAGNADFKVEHAPKWLEVETTTGKLTAILPGYGMPPQSVGTIRCKAKVNPEFEKTGVYLDNIRISANDRTYYIPVMYVSEGNPTINVNPTLTISYYDYNNPFLFIKNTGPGILLWDIISMPEWLTVDMDRFNISGIMIPQGNSYNLPLKFNSNTSLTGDLTGTIVLKTNDKNRPEVTISVTADLGTPQLNIYSYDLSIDFERTETNKSISFGNQGNGILNWSFESLPEWLSVSKQSGMMHSYNSETVTFTCNRNLLPDGQSEVKIILKTNDVNKPATILTVRARNGNNNVNVRTIEGNIMDACCNKGANILYYVTSQPNKLIIYDMLTKNVKHEIALSKAPTCLAVSEDFTKALVGHGGMISYVNLQNNSVTNTFEVKGVLADIEFAANGWCAYTEGGNYNIQWTNLYWVNLATGSYTTSENSVYENCIIKKVPNQNYIIGAEKDLSSGLYVYDITTRTRKASIFETIGKFWFIGDHIVSMNSYVFRISDITSKNDWYSNGLSAIGQLKYSSNNYDYYGIPFVDYCPASHSIFGLKRNDWDNMSSQIYVFEDNDYTLLKTYNYEDYYRVDGIDHQVQAHYVFANGDGTELSVLRKGKNNNIWSIEFIQITD